MSATNGDSRKVVCLGMPSYGQLTSGAARALYRPSNDPHKDVKIMDQKSSLLASNMNVLWCWALNTAHQGRCDYFAMLHADVEPEEFWLDKLIAELDAKDLDVLGVVVPIKDQRGVTSIALARPDGHPWKVHCRLTMKEIYRLPETFTSADLGHDLLINTGCWVCRFNEEWAKKVRFEVNDRICFDQAKKMYFSQVEPEDWSISRMFHELGLKVGATRKVELGHVGPMSFGNTEPWGANEFDREYLKKSVLDDRPPCDWFPHDCAGWLTENEGRELARLAEGKVVLEIGSYAGRSTICLAQKAKNVAAVDTFDGRGTAMEGRTLDLFKRNMRRHGVDKRVNPLQGASAEMLPNLPPIFDLIFIDGSHDRESVLRDAELAANLLRPEGVLVFHDYQRPEDMGVTAAVDEILAGGGTLLSRCETLAVVRPLVAVAV